MTGATGAVAPCDLTAEQLASLHAACFETPRPWRAAEFESLLAGSGTFLVGGAQGFALGRAAGAEAELLTIAVPPDARRKGHGRALLAAFHEGALQRGATTALLEVSAANAAAVALYESAGYAQLGRRRGYYRGPGEARTDALVMSRPLQPTGTGA